MLIKCHSCRGAKKILKLGHIEGNCPACEGAGVVQQIESLPKEKNPIEIKDDKKKKSRG